MLHDRVSIIWTGIALIGLGIGLGLAQWIGWETIGPLLVVVGGLAFFVVYVVSGFKEIGFVFAGTLLVLAGLFLFGFTLGFWEWGEMAELWPVFPSVVGVASLITYVVSGFKESGFVFVGVLTMLTGLFFFGFTLGSWQWEEMSTMWPAFPLIVGVAFFTLFVVDRKHELGVLGVGCVLVLVGGLGLVFTLNLIGVNLVNLWPLVLVTIGIGGLISGLRQMRSQE